jgi:aldehyde dehydrogenase (NAD+)
MDEILRGLGVEGKNVGGFAGKWMGSGEVRKVISPIRGEALAEVACVTKTECEKIISRAEQAFLLWRTLPAPKRGEVVRALGEELRRNKDLLGLLVTLEMGKPIQEGLGEVQEMIDICDYAVGLSRQLFGLTMQSERKRHRMFEQWHPLGVVGVITAFNFPAAVWSWNAAIALVCGDTVIWKPSSKTPLTAIAVTKITEKVLKRFDYPSEVCSLLIGKGEDVGDLMTSDRRIALVSYTGSIEGGRRVSRRVYERFGKLILELGGNNAVIVSNKGSLDIALKNVYFGAVGTSGQRCTTTRRVLVHRKVYDSFLSELKRMYQLTSIGGPQRPEECDGTTRRRRGGRLDDGSDRTDQARRGEGHLRWKTADSPRRLLRDSLFGQGGSQSAHPSEGDLCSDPVCHQIPGFEGGDPDT